MGRPRLTIPATVKLLASIGNPKAVPKVLAQLLVSPNYPAEERLAMQQRWEEIDAEVGFSYGAVVKQLIAAQRFRVKGALRSLECPTLCIYGSEDIFVPNENTFFIHRLIPGAQLVKIDGAGHELMTDRPKELLHELQTFIGQVEKVRAAG